MRFLLFLLFSLWTCPGLASIPTGQSYGKWRVSSITSVSGSEGNDASVSLDQGDGPVRIEVRWIEGFRLNIAIEIDECNGNKEFYASYAVLSRRFLNLSSKEMAKRLGSDFNAWIDQARLSCASAKAIDEIDLSHLDAAVRDFRERLKYLSQDEDHEVVIRTVRRPETSGH